MATKPRSLVGAVVAHAIRVPVGAEPGERESTTLPQNEDLSSKRRKAALASLSRNREALKLLSKA